jgi:predicted transcriptional regulator
MPTLNELSKLSRREQQIMDVIYARGEASATEVVEGIPDPPSRTAVRTFLTILEKKGCLAHFKRGREYVYRPLTARRRAGRSAIRRVLDVFFQGSISQAMATHLADPKSELSAAELDRLTRLIREARERGV